MSIVGSAGRRGDAARMTKELYWKMVEKAELVILNELKLDSSRVHLVSGGAAWAGTLLFLCRVHPELNKMFNNRYVSL